MAEKTDTITVAELRRLYELAARECTPAEATEYENLAQRLLPPNKPTFSNEAAAYLLARGLNIIGVKKE
jgi:hypothetical protein